MKKVTDLIMNVALTGMALILNGAIIMISLILNGPIILSVPFNLSGTTYTQPSTNSLIEKSQGKFIESVIPSARWGTEVSGIFLAKRC